MTSSNAPMIPSASTTSIGNHMKLDAPHELRPRVTKFYRELLGCMPMESPRADLDLHQFSNGFVLGVFYCDPADTLSPSDHLKAAWLEIKTPDPSGLQRRLEEFGVARVDYPDTTRFYFQAPGGQVFRLAPEDGGI